MSFAGGKPIKTKVVTTVGNSRSQITPPFDCELWYPVSLPTMTQAVKFSIWDWDAQGNELIGNDIIYRLYSIFILLKPFLF